MSIETIPLSKLRVDPQNVRHPEEGDLAAQLHDMQASLLEHGQLSPLVVRPLAKPKGHYLVLAGGRRLAAFTGLAKDGRIGKDHGVLCSVRAVDDATAHELSAAENLVRVALKPTEEFRLFAELADKGALDEDIARRFGIEVQVVRQRQRLGRLHPEIFDALDKAKISLDLAKAYASTEDQSLQLRVFKELAGGWNHGAHNVRNAIRGGAAAAGTDKMLEVVGVTVYVDAGGQLEEDLFGGGYRVLQPGTLKDLYYAKVDAQSAELAAKLPESVTITVSGTDVGRWVPIGESYTDEQRDRLAAIDKRTDEIHDKLEDLAEGDTLEDLRADRPEDQPQVDELKRELGALEAESEAISEAATPDLPDGPLVAHVAPGTDGMRIIGYYRPKGYAEQPSGAAGGGDAPEVSLDKPIGLEPHLGFGNPDAAVKAKYGLTADAIQVMRSHRRAILRASMLNGSEPGARAVASKFLPFIVCRQALAEQYGLESTWQHPAYFGIAGSFPTKGNPTGAAEVAAQPCAGTWSAICDRLRQADWMVEQDLRVAFAKFVGLSEPDIELAGTVAAALMLDRSLRAPGYEVPLHDEILELIGTADDGDIRGRHWIPNAAFFDQLPKSRRIEAVAEISPKAAKLIEKMPAADISAACSRFFSADAKAISEFGMVGSQVRVAKEWLPDYLRFSDRPSAVAQAKAFKMLDESAAPLPPALVQQLDDIRAMKRPAVIEIDGKPWFADPGGAWSAKAPDEALQFKDGVSETIHRFLSLDRLLQEARSTSTVKVHATLKAYRAKHPLKEGVSA